MEHLLPRSFILLQFFLWSYLCICKVIVCECVAHCIELENTGQIPAAVEAGTG